MKYFKSIFRKNYVISLLLIIVFSISLNFLTVLVLNTSDTQNFIYKVYMQHKFPLTQLLLVDGKFEDNETIANIFEEDEYFYSIYGNIEGQSIVIDSDYYDYLIDNSLISDTKFTDENITSLEGEIYQASKLTECSGKIKAGNKYFNCNEIDVYVMDKNQVISYVGNSFFGPENLILYTNDALEEKGEQLYSEIEFKTSDNTKGRLSATIRVQLFYLATFIASSILVIMFATNYILLNMHREIKVWFLLGKSRNYIAFLTSLYLAVHLIIPLYFWEIDYLTIDQLIQVKIILWSVCFISIYLFVWLYILMTKIYNIERLS